jgi:MFS family permease
VSSVPRPARSHAVRPFRSWCSRDFGTFFLGSSLSNIGTWFQNIAAGLLVYELTRSTLLVGAVNFAQFIGAFVLAPVAGAAADRFDRRRLLIVSQLGAATVGGSLAVLTALGLVNTPVVVLAASLLGLALAFMVPALLSLVPLLVPRADLDAGGVPQLGHLQPGSGGRAGARGARRRAGGYALAFG